MRLGPLMFPWWAAVVAAGLCAAGIALGNWQSGRADEKRAIAERLARYEHAPLLRLGAWPVAADDYLWHKVEARGEFDAKRVLYLGNRLYRGRPGYYVVIPLRIENGPHHILVLRGWLPSQGNAPPEHAIPQGIRAIQGIAVPAVARMYEPGAPSQGRVRQNIDLSGFGQESGLSIHPFFLEQREGADDGLVRDWPARDALLDKHRMYAGQWYSLAALSVVIFLVLSFRHGRLPDVA